MEKIWTKSCQEQQLPKVILLTLPTYILVISINYLYLIHILLLLYMIGNFKVYSSSAVIIDRYPKTYILRYDRVILVASLITFEILYAIAAIYSPYVLGCIYEFPTTKPKRRGNNSLYNFLVLFFFFWF